MSMLDTLPPNRTADMPADLQDKIDWCGPGLNDDKEITYTMIQWAQPEGYDWHADHESISTPAECDRAESILDGMYPEATYCSHTGYCPEEYWPENRVDQKTRKAAWS